MESLKSGVSKSSGLDCKEIDKSLKLFQRQVDTQTWDTKRL